MGSAATAGTNPSPDVAVVPPLSRTTARTTPYPPHLQKSKKGNCFGGSSGWVGSWPAKTGLQLISLGPLWHLHGEASIHSHKVSSFFYFHVFNNLIYFRVETRLSRCHEIRQVLTCLVGFRIAHRTLINLSFLLVRFSRTFSQDIFLHIHHPILA
jgi:hypothetical protein